MMCNPTAPPASRRPTPLWSRSCERSFPGHLDQVREARAFMTRMLDGWPAADDAVLLISELATNACTYTASGTPGGTFTVRVARFRGLVRAEVEDQGSTWDGNLSAAQPPHGLYLLQALSASCGTYPGARGWVAWYTLATPPGVARHTLDTPPGPALP
jgi:serine/threonine-protein kinase RsbW